jgi:hypothetical protein
MAKAPGKVPSKVPVAPAPAAEKKRTVRLASPDMVVIHPQFGEITVADLVARLEEAKKPAVISEERRKEFVVSLLRNLWSAGGTFTARQLREVMNKVKAEMGIAKPRVNVNTLIADELIGRIKAKRWAPFFVITNKGKELAGISVQTPSAETTEEKAGVAMEAAEFLEEK